MPLPLALSLAIGSSAQVRAQAVDGLFDTAFDAAFALDREKS
jgi:hypothetical protein